MSRILDPAPQGAITYRQQTVASCAALAAATAAALLAACAAPQERDPYCTEYALVPITVGDRVYFERGHCKAWQFGPTKQQQREFDERKQRRESLLPIERRF